MRWDSESVLGSGADFGDALGSMCFEAKRDKLTRSCEAPKGAGFDEEVRRGGKLLGGAGVVQPKMRWRGMWRNVIRCRTRYNGMEYNMCTYSE